VPRILRRTLPDGWFHVTARGVDGATIYRDDRDRWSFLGVFRDSVQRFDLECAAFCLTTNHYHLVVAARQGDLSRGVQRLNGVYAQRFNRRHKRTGHLFGGRFASWVVETEEHLEAAVANVLENPVRADLSAHPGNWPWARMDERTFAR
jgi:putative transposase